VYKVAIALELASDFRNNDYKKTEDTLINYDLEFSKGNVEIIKYLWKRINKSQVADAKQVLSILVEHPDHNIRVENRTLNVYTNELTLINRLIDLDKDRVENLSKPVNDKIKNYLLSNKNKIISLKYKHKYKITINPLGSAADNFIEWAEKMPDKLQLFKPAYRTESYFYASDLKIVSMCQLFLNGKIRRIDEFVTESEI
jgi:hypothetical protein